MSIETPGTPARKMSWRSYLARSRKPLGRFVVIAFSILTWSLWIAALLWVLAWGMTLRLWLWPNSAPMRFTGDVTNAWDQGQEIWHVARLAQRKEIGLADDKPLPHTLPWHDFFTSYLQDYDRQVAAHPDGNYDLDYPPLRLLIVSLWVKYERETFPKQHDWNDEATWPLIHLNLVSDTLAMLMSLGLVYYWLRRQQIARRLAAGLGVGPPGRSPFWPRRFPQWPEIGALLAAALLYFNWPLLTDGFGWPQWDGWVLPAAVGAMLFMSLGWGFVAGVILVIGSMAKGQMLLVVPVFMIWPLAQGEWRLLLRLLCGIAFGTGLATSFWLLGSPQSHTWMVVAVSATVLVIASPWRWLRLTDYRWAIATIAFAMVLVGWPWSPIPWLIAAALVTAVVLGLRRTQDLGLAYGLGLIGLGILIAGWAYDGDWNWYTVGISSAAERYQYMHAGITANLCSLLGDVFGWQMHETVTTVGTSLRLFGYRLQFVQTMDLEQVLALIYAATLVGCGIGAAMHAKKNDARVLVSLTAPWAAFYCLMPMMHERYMMWIAALSALAVPVGGGFFVLYVLFSIMSTSLIIDQLAGANIDYVSANLRVLDQIRPGSSYIVVLLLAFYVYAGIFPRFRYRPIPRRMLSLGWLKGSDWRRRMRLSRVKRLYREGGVAGVPYAASPTA